MRIRLHNFSPVLDTMVQDVGPMCALVYARVYRFCQLDRQQCDASLSTIADALNVSRRTIKRHVKTLVKEGYLVDMDTNVRNRPHRYRTTGKAELEMTVAIKDLGNQTKSPTSGSDKLSDPEGQIDGPGSDNLSDEDTCTEDTEQDKGAAPPTSSVPVNLGEWLTRLLSEKNKVAYLVFAYETLYPESPQIDFGKMGAFIKRVGGPESMLRYLYEFSGRGLSDPITYIYSAHKRRKNGKGKLKSRARNGHPDDETVEEQYQRSLRRSGLG